MCIQMAAQEGLIMNRKLILGAVMVAGVAFVAGGQSGESLADQVAELMELLEDLKQGAIIPFAAPACPGGWSEHTQASGRFLIGASKERPQGDVGGALRHAHTGWTTTAHGNKKVGDSNDTPMTPESHQHQYTTDESEHVPPYVAVIFCRLNN